MTWIKDKRGAPARVKSPNADGCVGAIGSPRSDSLYRAFD
jgi:hypothetical protein